jgi:hypothetical protein
VNVLNVFAAHTEQLASRSVAHLDRTVFPKTLAHGGIEQFADFHNGVLAGSVIVGEFNPGRILDPVLPESPVEAIKRHSVLHPERGN